MKKLFKFRYPKLFGLLIAIVAAYFIFSNQTVADYISSLNSFGYIGVFIAGVFFTFGFTTPFATGFFIILNPENIWLAALLGGFGAMLMDLFIFSMIKFSFTDEFEGLENTKMMKELSRRINKTLSHRIKVYLMYALAGIIIASPLPDEAALILLAGLKRIKVSVLALISFVMNTIGILILLSL